MKGQIEKANQAISSLQSAQEALKPQIKDAADAASAAQTAAAAAQAAADAAQAAADAAQATGDQAKIDAADAAKAAADADAKAVAAANDAAKAILAAAQAEENAIAKAEEKIQVAKDALEAKIAELAQAHGEDIAKINAEITSIKTDLNKVLGRVTVIEEKVAANAADIVKLNGIVEGLTTQQTETAQKVADLAEQLNNVETSLKADLKAAVDAMNVSLKALDEKAEALKKEFSEALDQAIADSKKALEDAKTALNTQIEGLDTKFTKELAEQAKKIGALEEDLTSHKTAFEGYKVQMQELHATFVTKDAFKAECDKINERLAAAEAELAKVDEKISVALADAKAYADALVAANVKQLNEKIAKNQEDITALQDALKADQDELTKAKKECADKRAELENLLKEFASTQDEAVKKELQDKIDAVQTKLDQAVKDLGKLAVRVAANETAIKDLELEISKLDGLISDLTIKVDKNTGNINKNATEIANLQKKVVEGLATAGKNLDKVKADLETKIKTDLDALENSLRGEFTNAVTNVSLIITTNNTLKELPFESVVEQKNTFGAGFENGPIEFGTKQIQTGTSFQVRVSPTDAILDTDMISLVNTKGENLDNFVKITKVERFDEKLSRSADHSGIWTVSVELKEYSKDAFNAIAGELGHETLYAVQVNNTAKDATRYATSEFQLYLTHDNFTPLNDFNFYVNETKVDEINNRYLNLRGKSLEIFSAPSILAKYAEQWWIGAPTVKPVFAPSATPNAAITTGGVLGLKDERTTKPMYPVVQGQEFTVSVRDAYYNKTKDIRAIYVTLDEKANAVESDPSEWLAWQTILSESEGLNKVFEGAEAKIKICSKTTEERNDILGLRVYAVNQDGTLVDPDGKAFYVSVGQQYDVKPIELIWTFKETWKFIGIDDASNKSGIIEKVDVPADLFNESWTKNIKTLVVDADTVQYKKAGQSGYLNASFIQSSEVGAIAAVKFFDKSGSPILANSSDLYKAKKVQLNVNKLFGAQNCPYIYDDRKPYNVKLTYLNAQGNPLKVINLSLKKILPTTIPGSISFKSQIADANGLVKVYPTADGSKFKYEMSNIFNFKDDVNFLNNITFKEIFKAPATEKVTFIDQASSQKLPKAQIEKFVIDSKTAYPVKITYNYGHISSSWANGENCNAVFDKPFSIMFCSRVGRADISANDIKLVYGKENKLNLNDLKLAVGTYELPWAKINPSETTAYNYNDSAIAFNPTGLGNWVIRNEEINGISKVIVKSADQQEFYEEVRGTDIKLVYEGTTTAPTNQHFEIKFIPTAESVDGILNGNVDATIIIEVTDKYGVNHKKSVKATIVPAE